MRKTFRKRKTVRKIKKNRNRTTKNRKMRGGYDVQKHGSWWKRDSWDQVVYTDEEKEKIKTYLANNPGRTVMSTEIRDNLFPNMPIKIKDNAAHEIQVVLGRPYSGHW